MLDAQPLCLPDLLEEGVAANERAKYYIGLLQLACLRVSSPDVELGDLHADRLAAGIDEERFDRVIAGSRALHGERVLVPHAAEIAERLVGDVRRMLDPLRAAASAGGDGAGVDGFEARLRELSKSARFEGDAVEPARVTEITEVRRGERDSLHLLVMDMHKALNELSARCATRDVGGARTHGIVPGDEALVLAFMRGVDRTRGLKFDHPGLSTVASRAGGVLMIQNDLGVTDAHIVVVRVEGLTASITYTDVHLARLEFFQRMLGRFPVSWEDVRSRRVAALAEGEMFFLCLGTLRAQSGDELADYLEHVGSRLVFVIDWNRARRMLRSFLRKADATTLLDRVAEEELGHRGFLELGGERLVFDTMAAAMRTPFRFGERLSDTLGDEQAVEFLYYVLRTASEGLREGQSRPLLRQKVQAELVGHLHGGSERLLGLVAEHARIIGDLATMARGAALEAMDEHGARVDQTREHERRADEIVVEVRALAERLPGTLAVRRVAEIADDAVDELDEATFHLGLVPPRGDRAALRLLAELCARSSGEYLRGIEAARRLYRSAERATIDEFLAAIEQVVALEHETDDMERRAIAHLVGDEPSDARAIFAVSHAARDLEAAADALLHAALALRDHVLGEVMAP